MYQALMFYSSKLIKFYHLVNLWLVPKVSTVQKFICMSLLRRFSLKILQPCYLRGIRQCCHINLNFPTLLQEVILIVIFVIEYIIRLWAAGCRSAYVGLKGRLWFAVKLYSIIGTFPNIICHVLVCCERKTKLTESVFHCSVLIITTALCNS